MKTLYNLLFAIFIYSNSFSQNSPRLLFTESNYQTIKTDRYGSSSTVYSTWKNSITSQKFIDDPITDPEPAEYDQNMGLRAKIFAFRYAMEEKGTGSTAFGDRSYKWIMGTESGFTNVREPGYEISPTWNRWMVNGLALINYCQAYDMLVGSGYFDAVADGATKKTAAKNKLTSRAFKLYGQVGNERAIIDLTPPPGEGIFWFLNLFENPNFSALENQVIFRWQVGNMRIIVASALGIAALTVWQDFTVQNCGVLGCIDVDMTKPWLDFAKKDIDQFLLGYSTYGGITTGGGHTYPPITQYADGAFAEGPAYFNYSAKAFIPFFLAMNNCQTLLGTNYTDYLHDPHFQKYFDWQYNIKMPNGLLPSLNDSQRDQKSYGGIFASVFGKSEYLGDLNLKNYQIPDMWIEGLCLLSSTSETFGSLPKLYVNADQGQIIFRNTITSNAPNSTYLCLQVERDMARYASEQHGQGDPGNYILYSEGSVFAQDPGYGQASISAPLNHASNHNTVYFADTPGKLPGDGPSSEYKLPSLTNVLTNATGDFGFVQYGEIEFGIRQEAGLLDVWPTNYAPVDVTHNITEHAAAIWLKQGRPYYNALGKNTRNVYFINGRYFIVSDMLDTNGTNISADQVEQIKYKVSINGVNGDWDNEISALASPSFSMNTATKSAQWKLETSGSQILQANINSIGGLTNLDAEAQKHELNFSELKYHGKLVAELNKRNPYSHAITILEPQPTTPYTTTTQRNTNSDNYLLYTVNGIGTAYARYDLIFTQDQQYNPSYIPASKTGNELKEIQTDAKFLVMSFGANKEDGNQVKIFSKGMSYLKYGEDNFLTYETGNIKTNFLFKKKLYSAESFATACVNQGQKVAVDEYGQKHIVYPSFGSIWHTVDYGGGNWEYEKRIDIGENPSIVVTKDFILHLVYEKLEGSNRVVYYRSYDGQWSAPINVSLGYSSSASCAASPVIATDGYNVVVAWNAGNTHLGIRQNPSEGHTPVLLQGGFTNAQSPSLAAEESTDNGLHGTYHLAYMNGGQIYHWTFLINNGDLMLNWTPYVISTGFSNVNPCIAASNGEYYFVWENTADHKVYCGSTGGIQSFTHEGHYMSKPSIALTFDGIEKGEATLLFQCGDHIGQTTSKFSWWDNSFPWSPVVNLGTGSGPNVTTTPLNGIPVAMWAAGSVAPYKVNVMEIKSVSGSLSESQTWGGLVNITGTTTIDNGSTLTINPGTVVTFASGTSLIVNGKIIANGTATQPINFIPVTGTTPGSWGSIYLSGAGADNSSISYANIQYGTEVSVNNNAIHVNITDCSITNSSSNGIRYSGSSTGNVLRNTIANSNIYHGVISDGGSYIRCDQNTITKSNGNHQGAGILFSGGGDGTVWQNDIQGWNWGIGAIWGSSPEFRTYNSSAQTKSNRITNCSWGIYAYQSAYPTVGEPATGWGYNSIFLNTKNIYFTSGGTLYAYTTYWGSGGPNPSTMFVLGSGCSVNTSNWLPNNPWGGELPMVLEQDPPATVRSMSTKSKDIPILPVTSSENVTTTDGGSLFEGIRLRNATGKREAKEFFKAYIAKNQDDQAAYIELFKCVDNENIDEIIQYFSNLPAKAAQEHRLLLPYLYLKKGDITTAKEANEKIFARNRNNKIGIRAKLNNFYIALTYENNIDEAAGLLNEIVSRSELSTQVEIELAQQALVTYPGISEDQRGRLGKGNTAELAPPDHYELFQNYPNPFNPVTSINYQIPTDGMVTLKIYDALGREVKTLVNEFKQTGRYTAAFDATNLSSGIYLYKIVADKYSTVKKMLLVK